MRELERLRPDIEWVTVVKLLDERHAWRLHVLARDGVNWGRLDIALTQAEQSGADATARHIAETIDWALA